MFLLRAAYRKVCLEHHPDKKLTQTEDPEEKERVEDHFKLVRQTWLDQEDGRMIMCVVFAVRVQVEPEEKQSVKDR